MTKNVKIQMLRALAMFCVVMIHSNAGGVFQVIDRPFINFAVAMFIFLSGYLTKIEIPDVGGFFKKRIVKVIVPYTIWTFIYGIAREGGTFYIVKNLLTARAEAPFYYIFVYVQLVLLTPLIGRLLLSKYRDLGWFITPIYILIVRYVCTLCEINLGFPFPGTLCLAWFIFYYLGMALGNGVVRFNWSWSNATCIYIAAIFVSIIEGLLWFYIAGNVDLATTQLRMTSIITSIIACLLAYKFITDERIVVPENKLMSLIVCIGDCAFGIFFVHIAFIFVLNKAGKLIGADILLHFPIVTVVAFVLSFLFVFAGRRVMRKYAWLMGV